MSSSSDEMKHATTEHKTEQKTHENNNVKHDTIKNMIKKVKILRKKNENMESTLIVTLLFLENMQKYENAQQFIPTRAEQKMNRTIDDIKSATNQMKTSTETLSSIHEDIKLLVQQQCTSPAVKEFVKFARSTSTNIKTLLQRFNECLLFQSFLNKQEDMESRNIVTVSTDIESTNIVTDRESTSFLHHRQESRNIATHQQRSTTIQSAPNPFQQRVRDHSDDAAAATMLIITEPSHLSNPGTPPGTPPATQSALRTKFIDKLVENMNEERQHEQEVRIRSMILDESEPNNRKRKMEQHQANGQRKK
jgi:hypothetical protein